METCQIDGQVVPLPFLYMSDEALGSVEEERAKGTGYCGSSRNILEVQNEHCSRVRAVYSSGH